ncbi:pseudouridine synthase [Acrocarpospora sp. B8E8]|uniref:pseudouridine synthase n=1 Tax=Acrocarpospora sp. B8E8 TaxID=3153572 RepID=UPI00325CD9DA
MNKRSTPSGDGRGRSRDGNPRSGGQRPDRSSFRADRDGSRGGYGKQDSRGGYGRPDSRGRDGGSGSSGSRGSSGFRDSRDSRDGGHRSDRSPSGDRYSRPQSREGRPGASGFTRRDGEGYGRSEGRDRPYPRSGDDRGRYAPRDDRGYGAPRDDRGGAPRDARGYGAPRDDRGGAPRDGRGYGSPRDDRGSRGSFGRSDDRASSSSDGGSRARYGRPDGERGGSRGYAPRNDSRGADRPRTDRDGYGRGQGRNDFSGADRPRGDRDGYAPRDHSRGADRPRTERPRTDRDGFGRGQGRDGFSGADRPRSDRDGFGRAEGRDDFSPSGQRSGREGAPGYDRRPDRDGSRGFDRRPERDGARGFGRSEGRDRGFGRPGDRDPRGSAPGGFRADRGGSRRDDVQTLGGGSRGRFGRDSSRSEFRTGGGTGRNHERGRKPVASQNPFKSAKQPLRDPDFYDRDYVDERDTTEVPGGERLQKVLAQAGVASRRACEELIGEGRVTVDGQVVRRFGARVDPAKQIIHVDGKRIPTAPDLVYYALNKPIGVVSTMEDPDGRPCLKDYVQELAPRLFHVGRLDTETEGLLLLTNDGELAHRLTHPSFGVQKKYWAKVPGPVPRDLHRVLRKGIELEDGLAKVDEFHIVQEHGQQALVEVVLHEGRKHIVRRLLEETGHRVIDLARIEFGPVKLGRLKPGTVRALSLQEVGELYAAVKL